MAKSKYEYVKTFEKADGLLPGCYMVCRVDGRSFHRFSDDHFFRKPNDDRAIQLMNRCALEVMKMFSDVIVAIGMSDEFSFVFQKDTDLFQRRESKINSSLVSLFTSCYTFYWSEYMEDVKMKYPPTFDSRIILYPNEKILHDYLCWRQVDCHINNLYNTCFWALVHSGLTETQAEATLRVKDSAAKNEMLFSQFHINYNDLPSMHRKGSIFIRILEDHEHIAPSGKKFKREKSVIRLVHEDLISLAFWKKYSLLENWPTNVQQTSIKEKDSVENKHS